MASQHAHDALWTTRGSRRYGAVLIMIVFSLVFQMAAPDRPGFRLASGLLQLGTFALALYSSDVHRRDYPVLIGITVLAAATLGVAVTTSGDTSVGVSFAVSAALVTVTLVAIGGGVLISILEKRQVTLQPVLGVICVYLLIGLLFSYVYGTIAAFGDQPFFAQGIDGDHQDQLYFSFITQTTVGYGDYTPAGHLGRSLAAIEALIGQIYLVTIVALMVSNLRPRQASDRGAGDGSGEAEA